MTTIEQLQTELEALPEEDFARLRWFAAKDWELWDRQIEYDVAAGKLDILLKEAAVAKEQQELRDL